MFANIENKREYYRLSMAISKAKKEGKDYQELLTARNNLKSHDLKFKLNHLNDLKNNLNNVLNLNDLNKNLNKLNENLGVVTNLLEKLVKKSDNQKPIVDFKKEITIKPVDLKSEQSVSLEEEKVRDVSLFIEPKLNEQIKLFCQNNLQSFYHVSDFVRSAFQAYEKKELFLNENSYLSLSSQATTKRNIKLDFSLRTIYNSFANKIVKTNQILFAYLRRLNS